MTMMSNFLEEKILNHTLRNVIYTPTALVYLALFITPGPADNDDTTKEMPTAHAGWSAYARQSIAWSAAANPAGTITNSGTITFPANNGGSVAVTHVGIYDALAAGNLLYHGALTTPKTLGTGDVLSFAASSIVVTMA